jgi:hypothetical protein
MATTKAISISPVEGAAESPAFERFAGLCTVLAGIINFLYAVAFVIIARSAPELGGLLSALFLLLAGLLITTTITALYYRLRETEPAFALWALCLGMIGALGQAIHGGYDLGNVINPLAASADVAAALASLPSQVDPRGLTTFGIMGIALLVIAWLMSRNGTFPRNLAYLGYALAILFIILYLARLIVFNPANPLLLIPVLIAGFIVNPAWYIWLGISLWRGR